ncbi:ThiF family adenylyltransferase [Ruania suaedae]|uniref:ThiF family adenylyltransferase n=1 Tax=Ruania suaedae TaxID=2897774 RepID=UPI001E58E1BC|nr:ThiF family adenylyltransferase [Ruania suaedae]UFU03562.1 ThiF family adenylyltransferase [Ruania suaedae]
MPLPPLVDPGPALSRAETDRLSRHILLPQLGEIGQRRLRAATVAVVGAGGLGSPALMYLAAAGVGTLRIIDHDVVERSNLHRQIAHGVPDIGRPKVESAAETLWDLAPDLTVDRRSEHLTADNADTLLSGADLVLDGTDTFATRYVVDDACARLGLPLVWGSVLRFDAQVSVFWAAPPQGRDPVRLRTLFPREPAAGEVPSCAEAGVLGALCGQVGAVMAHEAIKLIAGIGEPLLGRVLVLDALNARWTELPLRSSAAAGRQATPAPVPSQAAEGATPAPPIPRLSPAELDHRLTQRRHRLEDFILLDVRESEEYLRSSIPGSRLIPLARALTEAGRGEIGDTAEVIVYCAQGPRSEQAATDLAGHGYAVTVLEGGITAWENR